MRRTMFILMMIAVAVAVVLVTGPANAAYQCPINTTGTIWITNTIPDTSNGMRLLHLTPLTGGGVKVGSCSHDPAANGPTRTTLYEEFPDGNNKTGPSKSSTADCDNTNFNSFDGKVSKTIIATKEYHAMMSFDQAGISDHLHACVDGPVSIFEH